MQTKTELRLTPTKKRELGGLIVFELALWVGGEIAERWLVNSGQPPHQELMVYTDKRSYSGDQRPIPEAVYRIGPLEFAGGKFDWADSWGPGLGDFWASITRLDEAGNIADFIRSAFGFHWDENRAYSPGSLGCVVFPSKREVERFVKAMRKHDPSRLVVDYGFGTVPPVPRAEPVKPEAPAKKEVLTARIIANKNGAALVVSEPLPAGTYDLNTPADGWQLRLVRRD